METEDALGGGQQGGREKGRRLEAGNKRDDADWRKDTSVSYRRVVREHQESQTRTLSHTQR